jgi:hypothetical protein
MKSTISDRKRDRVPAMQHQFYPADTQSLLRLRTDEGVLVGGATLEASDECLGVAAMTHKNGADRSRPEEVRIFSGAAVYFLLVMVAGFAFGTLRELLLIPTLGRAIGEALEAPLMFAAIVASAWLATYWCRVPPDTGARVAVGCFALALVLLTELALSPFVRGSVQAWFESFTAITLVVSVGLWAAQAVMPVLVRR